MQQNTQNKIVLGQLSLLESDGFFVGFIVLSKAGPLACCLWRPGCYCSLEPLFFYFFIFSFVCLLGLGCDLCHYEVSDFHIVLVIVFVIAQFFHFFGFACWSGILAAILELQSLFYVRNNDVMQEIGIVRKRKEI